MAIASIVLTACGEGTTVPASTGSKTGTKPVASSGLLTNIAIGGVGVAGYTILQTLIVLQKGFLAQVGLASVVYSSSGSAALASDSMKVALNDSTVALAVIAEGLNMPIISSMHVKSNWFTASDAEVPQPRNNDGFPRMFVTSKEAEAGTPYFPTLGFKFSTAEFNAAKYIALINGATDLSRSIYPQVTWKGSPYYRRIKNP